MNGFEFFGSIPPTHAHAPPPPPPNTLYIPAHLAYDPRLPPVLLQTWIQLRGLAWGHHVTPCMTVPEMASILGKHHSTLYRHMSLLRNLGVLSWRATGSGTITVSFDPPECSPLPPFGSAAGPPGAQGESPPVILDSQNREMASPLSSTAPDPSFGSVVLPVPQTGIPPSPLSSSAIENQQGGEFEGGSAGQNLAPAPLPGAVGGPPGSSPLPPVPDAVDLYRSLVHLTPKPFQRRLIRLRVADLPLWQSTLEHWVAHAWNPRNLPGLLDLYTRGGPSACLYCSLASPPASAPPTGPASPLQHTLTAIDALFDPPAEDPPAT